MNFASFSVALDLLARDSPGLFVKAEFQGSSLVLLSQNY